MVAKRRKGYQNLYELIETKSDFPRPHRKDLMQTIFRDEFKKITRDADRAAEAALHLVNVDQISQGVSLGVDFRVRRLHSNPIAAAIDQPSSENLKYSIRSPIKIPLNYEKKLRDLDSLGREFEKQEKKNQEMMNELKKARIRLRFDPKVKEAIEKGDIDLSKPVDDKLDEKDIEESEEELVVYFAGEYSSTSSSRRSSVSSANTSAKRRSIGFGRNIASSIIEEDSYSLEKVEEEFGPEGFKTSGQATSTMQESAVELPRIIPMQVQSKGPKGLSRLIIGENSKSPKTSTPEQEPNTPLSSKQASNLGPFKTFVSDKSRRSFLVRPPNDGNAPKDERSLENWQARNVPYMLEIWAKAEGINLKELMEAKKDIEGSFMDLLEKIQSQTLLTGTEDKHIQDSVSSIPLLGSKESRISKNSSSGYKKKANDSQLLRNQKAGERPLTPRPIPDYAVQISDATYELIKRISKESTNNDNQQMLRAVVEKTLTGYDPQNGSWEKVEPMSISNNLPPKRKLNSPFKNVTPGTCGALIGQVVSDDGDVLPFDKPVIQRECDKPFELALPNSKLEKKAETEKEDTTVEETLKSYHPEDVEIHEEDPNSNHFHPIVIKKNPKDRKSGSESNEFNLKRFTSAIRLRMQDKDVGDELVIWSHYLDSHLPTLAVLPDYKSVDWLELHSVFVSCLRQEQHQNLQFEAVCGIIKMKGVKDLRRWDSLAYKEVLDRMLSFGNHYQKQIAGLECVDSGNVDVRVIEQIRHGLGDVDEDKRQESIRRLGGLGIRFAESIVQVLEQDSKHTSWRVRYDVVTLLTIWIPKLAPPSPLPPPAKDPDALETDSEEVLKALFPNGASTKEDPQADKMLLGLGSATIYDDEPIDDYPKDPRLHEKCIQLLLELMSNDWSSEVKNAASNALGDLKQGKSVLEWVFRTLKSLDPTKRVDALKCLTFMAVVPKEKLDDYVSCFKDPYSSVKIEACRVACALKANETKIIMSLLDMLGDSEYKVRAYAVKALGFSKSNSAKLRECLNWALLHDSHPAVRAEAVRAVYNLRLFEDLLMKNALLTVVCTDSSEKVKKEAEKVLSQEGIAHKGINDDPSERITVDGVSNVPFPHLLGDKPKEEVQIYLRQSLIGDQEVNKVIEQVRSLSSKEAIFRQVEEMRMQSDHVQVQGLDLEYDAPFKPAVKEIHHPRSNRRMKFIVVNKEGRRKEDQPLILNVIYLLLDPMLADQRAITRVAHYSKVDIHVKKYYTFSPYFVRLSEFRRIFLLPFTEKKISKNPDMMHANDFCIIKMPSGNSKIVQLKPGQEISLGKFGKFNADELIEKYHGPYEIYDRNKVRRVENPNFLEEFNIVPTQITDANNQNMYDNSEIQKLSQSDIEALKKQSLEGEFTHKELIDHIITNNENFNEKTEFSKAKYIKRKFKKFSKMFVAVRPTAKNLTEFYSEKNSEKIKDIRIDTLAQLLTFGNVRAGSKIMVCDDTLGLVGSAILERTAGYGQVYFFHDGQAANLETIRYCNFDKQALDSIVTFPWYRLNTPYEKVHSETEESIQRAEERYQKYLKDKEGLEKGDFDALIIASKFDPKQIIDKLSPFLANSGIVVCYEYRKELLLDAYNFVRTDKGYCNTHLTESWLREYQIPVFASGTHPSMMTSGSGGFLFTATKVTSEGVVVEKPTYQQKRQRKK